MKDYYGILGVPPSAGELEIKRAFRKLAVRYHPDKNPSPEARPVFHDINEAYDVLSDPEKRTRYDARRENPFAEIISEPVVQHRDPAYRRRRPRPPAEKEPPASFMLMQEYLPYMMWVSRIGLLTTIVFFLDFFLPYRQIEERIRSIDAVRFRSGIAYHMIETESGRRIKLYEFKADNFTNEPAIRAEVTRIFRSVITVSNTAGTYEEWVAYMYSTLIFFPVVLFVISLLAFIYRHRTEFCFSLNVAGFILLVINLVLI